MKPIISKKEIAIIVLVFILTLSLIGLLFYYNINKTLTIEATIKELGTGYIIIEDKDNNEYYLETNTSYNIGDRVAVTIKNINNQEERIKGDIVKIDVISRTISFQFIDEATSNQSTTSADNNINTKSTTEVFNTKLTTNQETEIIAYFEQLNNDLDNYKINKSFTTKIKENFIVMIDFLFYGGTINDTTFANLSEETKLQVLKLAFYIDNKISNYFPGYRENITIKGNKIFDNISSNIITSYLNITTEICNNNESLCLKAKDGLQELKNVFALTWDFIKNISELGLTKLEDSYLIWKEIK